MFGVPLGEVAVLAAGIVVGGIVTGILAGLFGVGGGAVPEEVRMQLCVGTSLAVIVPTSIRSFLAHRAKGPLPVEVLRTWALPVITGILTGSVVAAVAPSWVFKLAFVVVATIQVAAIKAGSWQR